VVGGPGPPGPQSGSTPWSLTKRNGNEGIGKPEALKYDFAGYWSRRITKEHRLVHKIPGDEVCIAARDHDN
jgi:Txe/YoeB family toxin of toxin-antitoxin system